MARAENRAALTSPKTEVMSELRGTRRAADIELRQSLAEIAVAQAELRDMVLRAIVAAETVATLSTLVNGRDGVAIREVAEMILEACTLADLIGQRMSKVDRALSLSDRRSDASRRVLKGDAALAAESPSDGAKAFGPGLEPVTQAEVDAIFG